MLCRQKAMDDKDPACAGNLLISWCSFPGTRLDNRTEPHHSSLHRESDGLGGASGQDDNFSVTSNHFLEVSILSLLSQSLMSELGTKEYIAKIMSENPRFWFSCIWNKTQGTTNIEFHIFY